MDKDLYTPDGCPIEVYRRMPAAGEPELIHSVAPQHAEILDLGAGTGRIGRGLEALGHTVIAVDESLAMLRHAHLTMRVCARIEELELRSSFAVVVLASYLVNHSDIAVRDRFLAVVHRYIGDTGVGVIQAHPDGWFDRVSPFETTYRGMQITVNNIERKSQDLLTMTTSYGVENTVWDHRFSTRRFEGRQAVDAFRSAQLVCDGELASGSGWLRVRRWST